MCAYMSVCALHACVNVAVDAREEESWNLVTGGCDVRENLSVHVSMASREPLSWLAPSPYPS